MSMTNEEINNDLRERNRLLEEKVAKLEVQISILIAIGSNLIDKYWHNKDTTSEFVGVNSTRTAPSLWRKLDYIIDLIEKEM